MQYIANGPDIPDALLQAHEECRVVFFCGAGISYPARLPVFSGLVKKLYSALAVTPNAVQQAAIKAGQLDAAIGLLEADIVGGRETVRCALAGILTPDLTATNATATHEALLTLGKCRNGHTRLITTNFDRLFEEVISARSLPIERFRAPLLPVPKNRWDGLVYLHGLLTAAPTASDLDRLVVSSGDFGLAYLTERWAARFVSELFRNYTVCFVGYSINDPVLRYMMDALAADRLLGESPPEMFAFGSYSKGKEEERANEWRAKNVTPILYREYKRHAYLRQTLHAIAALPQEGLEESAQTLFQALEGAAEQREEYWRNRVQPFWHHIWPKFRDLATPPIAESLSRLAIAARGEFPAALAAINNWLQPIDYPDYVVHLLHESGLCRRFPADALRLLDAVIAAQQWVPRDLMKCLDDIQQLSPELAQDSCFQRLREYSRRRGTQ